MSYNKKILNQIHKPLIKAQYGYSGKPTLRQIMQMPDKRYSPSPAVMDTKAGLAAASLAMGPYSFVPGIAGATYDVGTAARYAMDGQWDNVKEDLISAGLNILPTAAVYGALASMGKLQKAARARAAIRSAKIGNNFKDFASSSTIKNKVTGLVQEFDKAGKEISSMRPRSAAEVKYHNQNIQNQYRTGYTPEGPSEYMPFMSPKYTYGGQPCYECGGMYADGGYYDCPDQEKDPVTGKCKAEVVRGRQANAANKAATTDMNAWAKQVAAMDKEVARQNAAQAAGQLTFDYDWMGSPVDKAEKKAAMGQYKQFFQQNPNTFIADDTSGYSPEQKYVVASKLKQRISTPMGSKLFQQQYGVDPRYYDLQRLQSEVAPKMGGWNGMRNWLFNVFKEEGGPIVDPMGQWAYPGQVTRIPGSNITMQGVPYPVYGVGSNGQEQMMQPGQEYNFGGAAYVDEYPMMQGGGQYFFMNLNDGFNKRIKNTDYVKGEYNKGMDFHTKWLNSPMYNSMINASDPTNAKNITDQRKDRLSAVTMKYVDTPYGKSGAAADQLGNIEVYPEGIGAKGIGVHEMSHVTDTGPGQNLIPSKDRIDISRYSLASENMPRYEANKEYFNYVTKPSETRARLNEIRQGASENKLYDPFTQKVNPAIYNKLKNFKFNSTPGSDPLQQLKSAYSDEQILQMLNSVSKVNNNNIQDMMYAKQGGEMIRRADGSYSRRGLWDNIRANKGSGKKPSKEMLEQERKIKAKSMANGGTNNEGFEALPEYVQAKILSNMGYGGYYNPMMATGGEKMPPEIARARFAAAGNLDQMSNYGYAYGGYIPEMMYGGYDYMAEGGEPNGGMALGQMAAVADKMNKLRKFISPEQNLDPWIASKLAVIDDSAAAISDYMMYNPEAQEMEEGMPEMGRGGYTVTRSNDRKGKTHKVTGPDGTVKYFGDSKLGQHPKDPKRKAAFYARHKKNLAGNPFFRAFARKTWEDGGSTFSGNAFYQSGGPVEGEIMDVTPEEAEMLRKQGYQFEIV
jgi:hypothetical protein